jgi:Putative zinc dependent peptidase (DUF5700)
MRYSALLFVMLVALVVVVIPGHSAQNDTTTQQRVELTLDPSEAKQALVILHKERSNEAVTSDDWQKLFATIPYQWLKAREAAMRREFTDDDFRIFVQAPETQARTAEWEESLTVIERTNATDLGERVLGWLPSRAVIQARVFPLIKPKTNSFVWRNSQGEPAIFIYLEKQTQAQFETTVMHELHHIGMFGLQNQQQKAFAELSQNVRTVAELMGAFGEGDAVLAAAGSTDLRPHWEDDALARARWDSDMLRFNQDLGSLTMFFNDVLDGKLKGDAIDEKASTFFGYQGPWYTVGYEMAALVEKRFGRQVFTNCLLDPRLLLVRYNEVAVEANKNGASLALWPGSLLWRIYADHPPPPIVPMP